MKNPTQMMREILTSKKAQEIIDYISQIYGKSYVALWILQAIGTVLDGVWDVSDQLLLETTPETTTLLIEYWENQYGINPDPSLTIDQRRARILSVIQSGTACNPEVLANAVSGVLNGAQVTVTENVAKNTFRVNVQDYVEDAEPAIKLINQMKPAHLIYQIQIAVLTQVIAEIKVAAAVTLGIRYEMEVESSYSPPGVYQIQNMLVIHFGPQVEQDGQNLIIV